MHSRKIYTVALVAFCFMPYCTGMGFAQEVIEQDAHQKPAKRVLTGRLEHTEKLEPAPDGLRPGAGFSASSLPPSRESSNWYQIPEWFAGTFTVEKSVISKGYDYNTGVTKVLNQTLNLKGQETHGYQQDARGGIWHLITNSGTTQSEDRFHRVYNIVDWYGPEEISESRVVMRILATSVLVDKKTDKIAAVVRREDIKTYEPLKDGLIQVINTSKGFTVNGLPQDLQMGYSIHKRIESFRAVDEADHHDLRESLRRFLVTHGLASLAVPSQRQAEESNVIDEAH